MFAQTADGRPRCGAAAVLQPRAASRSISVIRHRRFPALAPRHRHGPRPWWPCDAAAGALVQAKRVRRPRELKIDQMEASGTTKPTVPGKCSATSCSRCRIMLRSCRPSSSRRSSPPRSVRCDISDRAADKPTGPFASACASTATPSIAASRSDLKSPDCQAGLMSLKASQHIERARHHLNDIAIAGDIASEHSLPAEPFRTSSHDPSRSAVRNKIPLAEEATSGNLRPQQKAATMDAWPSADGWSWHARN